MFPLSNSNSFEGFRPTLLESSHRISIESDVWHGRSINEKTSHLQAPRIYSDIVVSGDGLSSRINVL